MVNQIGGKNYKKGKKGGRKTKNPTNLFDTNSGSFLYAQVISKLGHNRLAVKLQTGQEVQAIIPGRKMKKVWINKDDYIVVNCVGEKYYDVIQKVTLTSGLNTATQEMGAKLDKDDGDLFNPFIENQEESDDEEDNLISKEEINKEDNDDTGFEDELEQINSSKLTFDSKLQIKSQKVTQEKLIKKTIDKARDINKKNRTKVYSEVKSSSETETSDDDSGDDSGDGDTDNTNSKPKKYVMTEEEKNKEILDFMS